MKSLISDLKPGDWTIVVYTGKIDRPVEAHVVKVSYIITGDIVLENDFVLEDGTSHEYMTFAHPTGSLIVANPWDGFKYAWRELRKLGESNYNISSLELLKAADDLLREEEKLVL